MTPEQRKIRSAQQMAYAKSEKGRAKIRAWAQSEAGRESLRAAQYRYEKTEKGRVTKMKWTDSAGGITSKALRDIRRNAIRRLGVPSEE